MIKQGKKPEDIKKGGKVIAEEKIEKEMGKDTKKFIVVSKDASGFGFAKMLMSGTTGRGNPRLEIDTHVIFSIIPKEDDDCIEALEMVGEGIVDKIEFEDIFANRKNYKDYIFIFDGNHNSDKAETLMKEGFKVFGGRELSNMMEHDREFGISLVEKAGLPLLEYREFESREEGLSFLDEHFDIAYVFKPDESDDKSWVTTCPDNDNDLKANREIYSYLKSQKDGKGSFILQERKKGVEINIEAFMYKGEMFFAQANFESKRKYNGDFGKMIGCSQDVCFHVPVDCKIVKETLGKLAELQEFKDYTGFIDANLIVADNEYWFLEFCGRFGYNAHPNLFMSIAISPLSEILSDWVEGRVHNFYRHFRAGYGASVSAMIDEPTMGLPLSFDDETDESRFYHYDCYMEDGEYRLAGYANEVGIAVAHDYDLVSACEEAIERFKRVHYPGKAGRTDLHLHDYQSNPHERLIACEAMGLFD